MSAAKVAYTVPELARALGVSRWTIRRWLDVTRIPYELRRAPGAARGGRIVVLALDLRAHRSSRWVAIGLGDDRLDGEP